MEGHLSNITGKLNKYKNVKRIKNAVDEVNEINYKQCFYSQYILVCILFVNVKIRLRNVLFPLLYGKVKKMKKKNSKIN